MRSAYIFVIHKVAPSWRFVSIGLRIHLKNKPYYVFNKNENSRAFWKTWVLLLRKWNDLKYFACFVPLWNIKITKNSILIGSCFKNSIKAVINMEASRGIKNFMKY